ncbi:universal stress protein [Brevibacillus ruminantium]|uniref:Universal stress protein n=1 Tax=Brevibacillus ruminantium TaxID=2950604 RepID=A0ABY4WAG7_9BACL|nr:universal stress protein [Brevibacillus ruminantium]USG63764.1 universal stress protein [Brevibacillus ruminantium]
MSSILVPVDKSPHSIQAVKFAIAFAQGKHSLTLLHVIQPFSARFVVHQLGDQTVEEFQREEAREDLKPLEELLQEAEVSYELDIRFGEPQEVIANLAKNGYAAVVMGTHGYGRMTGFLMQSVSYPTIHDVQIPVFLVPEEAKIENKWKTVLIAVDGSEHAKLAAEQAIQMGKDEGARFILLTAVIPPVNYAGMYGIGWEDAATLESWGEQTIRPYQEILEAAEVPFESKILIGDPATLIKDVAQENEADLIVLGHHGLGGIAGTLMGSVTFKVIHRTKTPLLIVK